MEIYSYNNGQNIPSPLQIDYIKCDICISDLKFYHHHTTWRESQMIQSPPAPPFTSSFPKSLNFHHLQFPDESFLRTNLHTMFHVRTDTFRQTGVGCNCRDKSFKQRTA